jgi:hypothetical protein
MCMFYRSLFIHLYFFFWPLCCLFFFDIRILITRLVSSNSSYPDEEIADETICRICLLRVFWSWSLHCIYPDEEIEEDSLLLKSPHIISNMNYNMNMNSTWNRTQDRVLLAYLWFFVKCGTLVSFFDRHNHILKP